MTTDRKPSGISWESFIERRIREAAEAGAFSALPGLGQPIPGIDEPLDENWWIKRKLRDEGVGVVPPVLGARLAVEKTLAKIAGIASETEVRRKLAELNKLIRTAHYSPIAGPPEGVPEVDVEAIVARWRESRSRNTPDSRPATEKRESHGDSRS
jgi:hypothetical protein